MTSARQDTQLRRRSVAGFIVGRTISSVGNNSTFVALVFAGVSIGAEPAELGLVLGAATVPRIVFTLLGGVAGDTRSRKQLLVACDCAMAAVQTVTGILLVSGRCEVWHLVALQAVAGMVAAYAKPAQYGILPLLVSSSEKLQRQNGIFKALRNAAAVAGPAIGGFLVTVYSPGVAFMFDSATFAVSALLMASLPPMAATSRARGVIKDLRPAFTMARRMPWITVMILTFMVYQGTASPAIYTLGPLLSPEPAAATWASILIARSVGGLVAPLALLRWTPNRPLLVSTLLMFLEVPFMAALILRPNILALFVAAALGAGALAVADVLWETTLQTAVPPDHVSRVFSLDVLGSIAISPLGYLAVGAAVEQIGTVVVLVVVLSLHVVVRAAGTSARSVRKFEVSHT